jgi:predicted CXXCH cytochrome family protein
MIARLSVIGLSAGTVLLAAAGWTIYREVQLDRELMQAGSGRDTPEREIAADPQRPALPHVGYVGSRACAECHATIFEKYQTHPMSRSLLPIADAARIESYGEEHAFTADGDTYFAEWGDDGAVHHIVRRGPDGALLYDQTSRIAYAIGSGQRGRSYVVNHDGLLFQSPHGWYSGQDRWDLSPGYEGKNLRFTRRIIAGCLSCHAGNADFARSSPNRFHDPVFHEASIGCERCHGPGEDHIAWRREKSPKGGDPIVNPSDLSPELRESVCNQCHLQGVERVTRYGRLDFDYRPGQPLSDTWTVFVHGTGVRGEQAMAVSQVEQMRSSRCFVESDGGLGCISCHDPHAIPEANQRVAHYRERCLACHADGSECALPLKTRLSHEAADSCIACHMPQLETHDIPHTAQTDHRVLRNPIASARRQGESVERIMPFGGAAEIPEWDMTRARGIMLSRRAQHTSDEVLAREAVDTLEQTRPRVADDLDALAALAGAYRTLGHTQAAEEAWKQVLALDSRHEDALAGLAFLYHDAGAYDLALAYMDRLLELTRWDPECFGRKAHMLGQLQRYPEAIEAAKQALELNPADARVHGWLSEVYKSLGEKAKSDAHAELLKRLSEP